MVKCDKTHPEYGSCCFYLQTEKGKVEHNLLKRKEYETDFVSCTHYRRLSDLRDKHLMALFFSVPVKNIDEETCILRIIWIDLASVLITRKSSFVEF